LKSDFSNLSLNIVRLNWGKTTDKLAISSKFDLSSSLLFECDDKQKWKSTIYFFIPKYSYYFFIVVLCFPVLIRIQGWIYHLTLYVAFALNSFDDQERNLTFVKTDFQVLKLNFIPTILSMLSILFQNYILHD